MVGKARGEPQKRHQQREGGRLDQGKVDKGGGGGKLWENLPRVRMLGDRNGCTPVHEGEKGVGCYGGLGRGGGGEV